MHVKNNSIQINFLVVFTPTQTKKILVVLLSLVYVDRYICGSRHFHSNKTSHPFPKDYIWCLAKVRNCTPVPYA